MQHGLLWRLMGDEGALACPGHLPHWSSVLLGTTWWPESAQTWLLTGMVWDLGLPWTPRKGAAISESSWGLDTNWWRLRSEQGAPREVRGTRKVILHPPVQCTELCRWSFWFQPSFRGVPGLGGIRADYYFLNHFLLLTHNRQITVLNFHVLLVPILLS